MNDVSSVGSSTISTRRKKSANTEQPSGSVNNEKQNNADSKENDRIFHYSVSELLERPLPPEDWLIKDIWSENSVGFIGGIPKAGKSYLALYMGICVATGANFLGKYKTSPGNVFIISEEGTENTIHRRFAMICKGLGIDSKRLSNMFISIQQMAKLDEPKGLAKVANEIHHHNIKLLIIDPLSRVVKIDENDQNEVKKLLDGLRSLQKEHSCNMAIIHHYRKQSKGDHFLLPGQRMRGSGDFHAYSDSALYLTSTKNKAVSLKVENRDGETLDVHYELFIDKENGEAKFVYVNKKNIEGSFKKKTRANKGIHLGNILAELKNSGARGVTREELRKYASGSGPARAAYKEMKKLYPPVMEYREGHKKKVEVFRYEQKQ